MTHPLPPDHDLNSDDLPLRHRPTRAREAEIIRQEFVRSRKTTTSMQDEGTAKELTDDES